VAVEPLPWAFKILKKNVKMNELKNVTLVNKALWDGQTRTRITDRGVGSSVGKGDIEVETVSVDQLGKFSIVKMDIEGAEGVVVKGDWLENVCQVAMKLHGRENIEYVPSSVTQKGVQDQIHKVEGPI
jgi:methyltransferase, FkbM family